MNYLQDSYRSMFSKLLPSAVGAMLSETVASLLDTVILSHYLGPNMLSVVSICMPIYMFVNVLSMLIVSGGATLYAQYIGRDDQEEAQRYYSCSIIIMVMCGAVMMIGGILFTRPIIVALGGGGSILESTVIYARVLFSFMIPLSLYQQLMVYVRFDGAPLLSLTSTIVCAVVNLVLDVLFVGPLGLGAAGAALATCIAYTVAMLINAAHLLSKQNHLILRRKSLSVSRVTRLLKTGVPISITQLGMAIATSVFNIRIMEIGGERFLSIYAVITQLSVIAMALYEGIGQACQPILAACFGAGKHERIRHTIRYAFIMEFISMLVITLVYHFGAGQIASLFSMTEESLRSDAMRAIHVYALSLIFTGFNTVIIYYFQSQENEMRATLISMLAGTILPIALLFILTQVMGKDGTWWTYLGAQGLTLICSNILYKRSKGE